MGHEVGKSPGSLTPGGEPYLAFRVLFLIRGLEIGGAQRQLVELLKGQDRRAIRAMVAVWHRGGALEKEIADLPHVELVALAKRCPVDVGGLLWRFSGLVRRFRPQVIYAYQPVANELALLAGRLTGVPVVCGLRTADADYRTYHWLLRGVVRVGALLSPLAGAIVANSQAGRRFHLALGYASRRMHVIPNGIDCDRFVPDSSTRAATRERWRIPPGSTVIGVVGRIDPHKDHQTLLSAMARLADIQGLQVVCVGGGSDTLRRALEEMGRDLALETRVHFVGEEADMPAVYGALDLLVSSSISEGFSNVIAEAMSAGVPCVVTDAGDSAHIVGSAGEVVPQRNPVLLADGIRRLLSRIGPEASHAARARIVTMFSRTRMVESTSALLCRVATTGNADV